MQMNEPSNLNRTAPAQRTGLWLAAGYASFFAWLLHGFAFRAFLASLRELAVKFLMRG